MDAEKRAKQLAALERARAKGRLRYILVDGVLGWGLTTAALYTVIWSMLSDDGFLETVKIALVTFPFAGVLWGWLMWLWIDKRVRVLRNETG